MERNEISLHEVKVFHFFRSNPGQWFTNKEVIEAVSGVAPRTVRHYTLKLMQMGLLDQAELFPDYHYRLAEKFDNRNPAYARRLAAAVEIFASKTAINSTGELHAS